MLSLVGLIIHRYMEEAKKSVIQTDDGDPNEVEKLILPQFYTSLIGLVCIETIAAVVFLWEHVTRRDK